jgi:hypothetical protein
MTVDIPTNSPAATADFIGQATAVEQARAVAEVQAAIVVAQQVPRDEVRALAQMRRACEQLPLASRAFYSVPNRGSGPSVHLARDLARVWGNVQYGVHELRRDDDRGESEIQAFAWDVETNTRSTRTFIAPHVRMAGGKRRVLVDIGDIYLSNQNIGARAVRECLFSVLPPWFTDEAQDICRETIARGDGKPLAQQINEALEAYAGIDVAPDQLEQRLGRRTHEWAGEHLAQLRILFQSIRNGEVQKDEELPARRVTVDELIANPQTAAGSGNGRTGAGEAPTDPAGPAVPQTGEEPVERNTSDGSSPTSPAVEPTLSAPAGDPAETDATVPGSGGPGESLPAGPPTTADEPRCSLEQRTQLGGQLERLGVKDNTEKGFTIGVLVGRKVEASKHLSVSEADGLLKLLESCRDSAALQEAVIAADEKAAE